MSINSPEDLEALQACAKVSKETLATLKQATQAGVSTKTLELLAKQLCNKYGLGQHSKCLMFSSRVLESRKQSPVTSFKHRIVISKAEALLVTT